MLSLDLRPMSRNPCCIARWGLFALQCNFCVGGGKDIVLSSLKSVPRYFWYKTSVSPPIVAQYILGLCRIGGSPDINQFRIRVPWSSIKRNIQIEGLHMGVAAPATTTE
jgi:hypothetical protein